MADNDDLTNRNPDGEDRTVDHAADEPAVEAGQRPQAPSLAVRYGRMRHVGEFSYSPTMRFTPGRKLVVATDRGIEIGEPVPFTCAECQPSIARDQQRNYARTSGGDVYRLRNGRVLRQATDADLAEFFHIERDTAAKLETCARFASELGLQMRIVDCEHLFGGERIVFYFMAEERVDFRELVRRLAGEYQTRIEMRQVGARDEARLLADYETCGRECCCRNFLKTLKPINMQMAKMQKATLDPAKVSGRCGRLKCCLRYEHETYETLVRRMPRLGSRIACAEGTGKVVDRQILTQLVRVLDDDGRLFTIPIEEISDRDLPPPPPRPAGDDETPSDNRRSTRARSYPSQRPPQPRTPTPSAPNQQETFPDADEDIIDLEAELPNEDLTTPSATGEPDPIDASTHQAPSDRESSMPGTEATLSQGEARGGGRPHHRRGRRGRRRGQGRRQGGSRPGPGGGPA